VHGGDIEAHPKIGSSLGGKEKKVFLADLSHHRPAGSEIGNQPVKVESEEYCCAYPHVFRGVVEHCWLPALGYRPDHKDDAKGEEKHEERMNLDESHQC